jgi:acyl transferase domain-containing protein
VVVSPGAQRWFVFNQQELKMTQFAMVFPGQGSQTLGMLAELAAENPLIEQPWVTICGSWFSKVQPKS